MRDYHKVGSKVVINKDYKLTSYDYRGNPEWFNDWRNDTSIYTIQGIQMSLERLDDGYEVKYTLKDDGGYLTDGFVHNQIQPYKE